MLTVGSAFAGIGGFDLGFAKAGMRTLWQIERDAFRRRVLAKHFPGAERHEDVRHVTGSPRRWADEGGTLLEYVTVFCAGVPCQPVSYAGLGLGADDERWLWPDTIRLVRELRPRWIVLENPTALLTRGLDWVLGELAASGLDAEWDCVPASAVGAPHRRDRVWIVAYPNTGRQPQRREHDRGAIGPGQQAPLGDDAGGLRADVAHAAGEPADVYPGQSSRPRPESGPEPGHGDRQGGSAWRPRIFGEQWQRQLEARREQDRWWKAEPDVGRVAHGVPARVDRLAALGDSLVHVIPELIGRRIIEWEEGEVAA